MFVLNPKVLPTITVHVVPDDKKVEILKDTGMNIVVARTNINGGAHHEDDVMHDARLVIEHAILYGSATNSYQLKGNYKNVGFEYEGCGSLNEYLSQPGLANANQVDLVDDTLNNTNIQLYMIFMLMVVKVGHLQAKSSNIPYDLSGSPSNAYLNKLFRTQDLENVWSSNVVEFDKLSDTEYSCLSNNCRLNLTCGENVTQAYALKLFSDMLGVGEEIINVREY